MKWPTVALGELFEITRGGSPRPINDYLTDAPDGLNWVSISDATESGKYIRSTKRKIKPAGASRSRIVEPGDFLLTNSMSFGRPYIMATSGCIHDGWLSLRPTMKRVDPDYLFRVLESPQTYAMFERLASGVTVKNLNIDLVRSVEIPLPPLDEQRRIAAILDQADALRRVQGVMIDRLDDLEAAMFRKRFDFTKSPRVPLASLVTIDAGLVDPTQPQFADLPHIGPEHIVSGTGEILPYRTARSDGVTSGKFLFEEGCILYSKIRPALNKVAIAPTRGVCSADMYPIRPREAVSSAAYVLAILRSKDFADHASTFSNRANIPKINREQLLAYRAPAAGLDAQEAFSRDAGKLGLTRAKLRTSLARLDTLFATLQHRAFSGELTRSAERELEAV